MAQADAGLHFLAGWALAEPDPAVQFEATVRMQVPYRVISRLGLFPWIHRRAEQRALEIIRRAGKPSALHLWFGASPDFVHAAKQAGAVIFREMVNTHQATARRIVNTEAERCGLPAQLAITDAAIASEREELELCDYIISPSSGVDSSLAEIGIAQDRIIQAGFGWDPDRFAPDARSESAGKEQLTALFVGQLSIRKGVHLALEAWEAAQVPGKFLLVGEVDRDCKPILARYLSAGRVEHHDYTPDIARHYAAADVLLFPTLEEGAPLVCYEAAGNGVPIITSSMGSARLVEHGVNGAIVDPHDREGLIAAIRSMQDHGWRAGLSAAARKSAGAHTWQHAARFRLEAIGQRMA